MKHVAFLGKKRKAIVKGNSVMEFGSKPKEAKEKQEGSFLGVGLMSTILY